jgi:hypothetical protein
MGYDNPSTESDRTPQASSYMRDSCHTGRRINNLQVTLAP